MMIDNVVYSALIALVIGFIFLVYFIAGLLVHSLYVWYLDYWKKKRWKK